MANLLIAIVIQTLSLAKGEQGPQRVVPTDRLIPKNDRVGSHCSRPDRKSSLTEFTSVLDSICALGGTGFEAD